MSSMNVDIPKVNTFEGPKRCPPSDTLLARTKHPSHRPSKKIPNHSQHDDEGRPLSINAYNSSATLQPPLLGQVGRMVLSTTDNSQPVSSITSRRFGKEQRQYDRERRPQIGINPIVTDLTAKGEVAQVKYKISQPVKVIPPSGNRTPQTHSSLGALLNTYCTLL